jgi:galactose mutarotase-like enzyme
MMNSVTIEHDNGLLLVVNPRGGMMHGCANMHTGVRLLYPFFIRSDGKERGGCPICFPAFGSPAPVYAGEKQHGWLRETVISTVSHGFSASSLCIHRLGGLYTSRVAVNIMHTIYATMLASRLQFIVSNKLDRENEKALVRPGFHPYFPNEGKTEVDINGLKYTEFTNDAQCIMLDGASDIIINTGDLRIRMRLEGFDLSIACVYLWSDAPEKYFCVEPVVCARDPFVEGRYMQVVCDTLYEIGMLLEIID